MLQSWLEGQIREKRKVVTEEKKEDRKACWGGDFWVCSGAFEDEEALRDKNT